MRFQLHSSGTVPSIIVQLNQHLRMPLESYGSSESCTVLDVIEMSNLNWKIVLDEAFRSIESRGVVEFTFKESTRYDLRRMWLFLGRRTYNRNCCLIEYSRILGNQHRVKVGVTRTPRNSKTWSICYISDGKNISQINRTAEIVAGNESVEILVSGPKERLLSLSQSVIIVDEQNLPREAMISLKKNMLVEKSKNENLLLLHDRYLLSEDFFARFEEYGYDFDVVVPKQMYMDTAVEFPGLLAEENNKLLAVDQVVSRDDFTVNGGCIVIKRDLAKATPLNSFLAWQEAEDADWSLRLTQNGELPRPLRNCVIYTVGTDLSKTAHIKPVNLVGARVDFLSEIDCLLANNPVIFFEQIPSLLRLYSSGTRYTKQLEVKCQTFLKSWDSQARVHMTPLRYCFALTFSLSLRIGRKQLKVSRKRALLEFCRYARELAAQSEKRFFLVGLVSLWFFSRHTRKSSHSKLI